MLAQDHAERREGELGIADEPEVDREVLRDLVRVEVDVDDPRARREDARERGEDLREDVRADDQDRVGRLDDRLAVVAEHVAEVAAEERVRLVDVDLGRVGAPHVGTEDLGDLGQLPLRAGHRHAVAHDDHRPLGTGEQVAACAIRRRRGRTRVAGIDDGTIGSSLRASRTSAGRATKTGPVGAVPAILMARRRTRSTEPGSTTRVAHFVTGRAIETRSAAIWASIAS